MMNISLFYWFRWCFVKLPYMLEMWSDIFCKRSDGANLVAFLSRSKIFRNSREISGRKLSSPVLCMIWVIWKLYLVSVDSFSLYVRIVRSFPLIFFFDLIHSIKMEIFINQSAEPLRDFTGCHPMDPDSGK